VAFVFTKNCASLSEQYDTDSGELNHSMNVNFLYGTLNFSRDNKKSATQKLYRLYCNFC